MLTYHHKNCKHEENKKEIEGKKLKKVVILALIACLQTSMISPLVFASESSKSDAQPKQFKSYASKSKKDKKHKEENKFEYLNVEWWENFNDPVLNDYIARAVQNNHDLKAATLAVEEYYQNVKAQFSNELPQVGVGFAPNYLKMPGTTSSDWAFAIPVMASYEVDLFLKNRDKTKSVKKSYEASKFDERATYIAVVAAVGTTYFNVVKLDKMIELQEEIVKSRESIYDLMLKRNREGLTSTADTIKANKALVSGQTELIELKKQREKALNQLAVLIGESPANSASLERTSLDALTLNSRVPSEISSEVIMSRPDYLKAEKMVEKAGIDVRVARKEFLPSINLLGLALFNTSDFGSMFTTKSMLTMVGAGIMAPIFTGGRRFANLRLKKAQYERILHNYYQTNLTAIQEVNDSLMSVKLDKEKMERTLKQYDLESEDYRYNTLKYEQGTISQLDLIQFKENLLSIDQLVAQQKVECMVDSIGLYKAAGSKL